MTLNTAQRGWWLAWVLVAACSKNKPAEPPNAAPVAPKTSTAAKDKEPAAAPLGPTVTAEGFALKAKPAAHYQAGKASDFEVHLQSRGKWHLNQEFPVEIVPTGPSALQWSKSPMTKADASVFTDNEARFKVPFTASKAGSYAVQAKVAFATCTTDNCVPDERTLAFQVTVK